tara:strand:- start:51 stop:515 length:465 start_codon:yes stop_codon:yes gene_type:complete
MSKLETRAEMVRPANEKPPKMPFFLKLLTLQGIVAPFMIVWVLIPGEKNYGGLMISYVMFWRSGIAMKILLGSIPLVFCSYCFIRRRSVGRYVYVGIYTIGPLFLSDEISWSFDMLLMLINGVLFALFYYWYLFRKRNVQVYFQTDPITCHNYS